MSKWNSKMEEVVDMFKAGELHELLNKKEQKKKCNVVLWIFAIVGAVAAIGAIAYAVYRYLTPDYLEDFEDDFDDDFDDDDDDFFEDEEESFVEKAEHAVDAAKDTVENVADAMK